MNEQIESTELKNYIQTALWSSNETIGEETINLDNGQFELSADARQKLNEDITKFWEMVSNDETLCDHPEVLEGNTSHDFWLTRNGHGAGFWDGDYPETGDRLTEMAKSFGHCDLYVSDQNQIEVYG